MAASTLKFKGKEYHVQLREMTPKQIEETLYGSNVPNNTRLVQIRGNSASVVRGPVNTSSGTVVLAEIPKSVGKG